LSALSTLWRPFTHWGTVLSLLLALALCSIAWTPAVAVFVVLLLYTHELGHVIAALWRGVNASRVPFLLPGLAQFVVSPRTITPGRQAWDEALILLGGPIIGGGVALAAGEVGLLWHAPSLALAGAIGLLFNLLNLAPFSPLDGGRLTAMIGLPGFVISVLAGMYLWFHGTDLLGHTRGPLVQIVAVGGMVQAYRAARQSTGSGRPVRFGILSIYVTALVALTLLLLDNDATLTPASAHRAGLLDAWTIGIGVFCLYAISTLAWSHAWKPERSAAGRYLTLALTAWPQHLVIAPGRLVVMVCLALQALGVPGLRLLEACLRAGPQSRSWAPSACAWGYDCLHRLGVRDADAWLQRMIPVFRPADGEAMNATFEELVSLGYRMAAHTWLTRALHGASPAELSARMANNLAWALLKTGHPGEALPFAQAAVVSQPDNTVEQGAYEDTLGQVLLALGAASEAEKRLRHALDSCDRPETRVALAQALAAQRRYAAAATMVRHALAQRAGPWAEDEPSPAQVQAWLDQWRRRQRKRLVRRTRRAGDTGTTWQPRRTRETLARTRPDQPEA
jgi:tetratricopeptide (TPR) repeat protein